MSYQDEKYLALLSSSLRNFKKKGSVYNFSCPICLDSTTDRRKARGYCFSRKGVMIYKCHLCSLSTNVKGLLRLVAPDLYRDYKMEEFLGSDVMRDKAAREAREADFEAAVAQTPRPKENPLSGLLSLSELPSDHIANLLVAHRRIPPDKVRHCDAFKAWTNVLIPGSFEDIRYDESRLVIPFMRAGKLVGFQGRSYQHDAKIKYYTKNLDMDVPLLYGIDDVKDGLPIIAVEGPIDSMFVTNGVASAGGSISASVKHAGLDADRVIVCYDNEPRSVHTVKKMRQASKDGYAVCLWPESFRYKDINDSVIDSHTSDEITAMIVGSAKRGLAADLGITMWRKCDA